VKTYEALLLVEPTVAAKEWTRVPEEVDRIVKRHGAAVLSVVKFGERKLAFPVRKSNRGSYVVAYFSSPEKELGKIKADFQLSEIVMRSLILAHAGELRTNPPRDFETAGPLPPKTDRPGFVPPSAGFGGGFGGGPGGPGGGGRPPWEDRGPRG
jgi:small subunit ribosomal protein S6